MASRSTIYRQRLKDENPQKYQEYLDKQKAKSKEYREKLNKQLGKRHPNQNAINKKEQMLALQRERQKRYRENQKQNRSRTPSKLQVVFTPKTTSRNKKEYNRLMKEKQRSNMTSQKIAWVRKKDRERKAKKRAEKRMTQSIQQESASTSNSSNPFPSKKSEWNITSNVKKSLPKSPNKFAKFIHNIMKKVTPRKRKALSETLDVKRRRLFLEHKNKEQLQKKPELNTAKYLIEASKKYLNKPEPLYKQRTCRFLNGRRKRKFDESKIKDFYKRGDISRVVPQKRFATKEGPGYLMQVSVTAAYSKFISEYGRIIGLSKFAQLRPRNVRKLSKNHREYCVCVYCINVRYKLLALSRAVTNDPTKRKLNEQDVFDIGLCPKGDSQQFYNPECINGTCKNCSEKLHEKFETFYQDIPDDTRLSWNRWEKDETKRRVVVTKKGTKKELLAELVSVDLLKPIQGTTFFQHLHNAKWQFKQYDILKSNLPKGYMIQIMDFAKNRALIYQDEIKSAFYTQPQVTMHPFVTFYRNAEGNTVREASIIISEDNNHDYHAVNHYKNIVDKHLEDQVAENIEMKVEYSDGCSSQYKSKGPFADLALRQENVNRNYFGSEHGKGECDAEIGVINRAIDRAIISKQVIINNSQDLYDYLSANMQSTEALSKRRFFHVKEGDIKRDRPETEVKPIDKTRKIHQINKSEKERLKLEVRSLSCFCSPCRAQNFASCINKMYVENYKPVTLERINTKRNPRTRIEKEPKSETSERINTKRNPRTKIENEPKSEVNKIHVTIKSQKQVDELDDDHELQLEDPQEIRKLYFQRKLDQLQNITSYEEVEIFAAECLDSQTYYQYWKNICIDPNINVMTHKFVADAVANYLPKTIPHELTSALPVLIFGDGNCLPRSASVLAFGNETNHEEIRVHIIVELVKNIRHYLNPNYLGKGVEAEDREKQNICVTYAMFSDLFTPGEKLTPLSIERIYQKEILQICQRNTFMGIWQICALSTVLKTRIYSIYPKLGAMLCQKTLNRYIDPVGMTNQSTISCGILWTSNRHLTEDNWVPNHFVPLIPVTGPSFEMVDDDITNDESPIDSILKLPSGHGFSISNISLGNFGYCMRQTISSNKKKCKEGCLPQTSQWMVEHYVSLLSMDDLEDMLELFADLDEINAILGTCTTESIEVKYHPNMTFLF
ncbi:uncharacterized protein LOC125678236 isoform X3 [Ostrea edulis]|uniref:uncharacterized protein LOC125678236 isoform X3 n=1 Tax=Ostrea edulis TaxID=37623 RepID=UPI0024AEE4F7|nr:uncharacterized protein LOC125678236 isoform X3 [Ostrea edulis]